MSIIFNYLLLVPLNFKGATFLIFMLITNTEKGAFDR